MDEATEHPPIDRELAETVWPMLLEQKEMQSKLTDEEFQQLIAQGVNNWDPDVSGVDVHGTTISSAGGQAELPVLILRPREAQGPLPCLYYIANGGKMQQTSWVGVTDYESQLVAELNVALVSISPRVGPEHPHPAQVEDAYAGLLWIVDNAERLNIDPARFMVMGKSGGGGIAAATALYARDRSGPAVSHQILIYPMLDDRGITVSSSYDVAPWTAANNRVGWSSILGDSAGGVDVSPYAAPARATDLAGLPPTYMEVGSSEIFRDEDLDYALRLARAGVPVEIHSWQGGFHAFEVLGPDANVSRACLAARTSYFQRALRATATLPHCPGAT